MRGLIFAAATMLAITLAAKCASADRVINGELVDRSLYPAVVLLKPVGCTATVVGPKTIITAAHCAKKTRAYFELSGQRYDVTLTRSPKSSLGLFGQVSGHDMALGLSDVQIDLPLESMALPDVTGVAKGMAVELVGYGCTKWYSSVGYGELRRGWADITGFSNRDYEFVARGRSAICQGDSGGPAFSSAEPRRQVGVHSKGNGNNSYEVRLDTEASKEFLKSWMTSNNAEVCGLNKFCGESRLNVGDTATCVDVEVYDHGTLENRCPVSPTDGKPYTLVEVSSTTCSACVVNFPIFAKFAQENKDVLSTRTILVDRNKQDSLAYLGAHPNWFDEPVALDVSRKVMKMFGARYTPTQYLLDSEMKILWMHVGVMTEREKNAVRALVRPAN